MDPKKKNMLLIGLAAVLLIGAVLIGFRDTLFGGGPSTPTPEVQAAIEDSAKAVDVIPPDQIKSNFSKTPRKVGE